LSLKLGNEYSKQGLYEKALEEYENIDKDSPLYKHALFSMEYIRRKIGRSSFSTTNQLSTMDKDIVRQQDPFYSGLTITNQANNVSIAFVTDNNFVVPTSVAIASLINNRHEDTHYTIYIITDSVDNENKKRLCAFENQNVSIKIIEATSDRFASLHKHDPKAICVASIAALLKFEIPNLIDCEDKILYLDGDILVKGDLKKLYDTDVKGFYAAVAHDTGKLYFQHEYNTQKYYASYFNSGVMLLNLKLLRDGNVSERLIQTKQNMKSMNLMDQNVFNVVFGNKAKIIDIKYNFLVLNLKRAQNKYTIKQINELFNSQYENLDDIERQAIITHFSSKDKPWKYFDGLYSNEWYKYFLKSPFKDVVLKREWRQEMPKQLKISIIIPVYNASKYLIRCLNSVIHQTLKEIEIICIDDGSTDNSLSILKGYSSKDCRFIVLAQTNQRQGAARNRGLDIAKAPYIMFVDSDDWLEFDTLENFYDSMINNNVYIVIGDASCVIENKTLSDRANVLQRYYDSVQKPNGIHQFDGSFAKYRSAPWCKLFRKDIIDKYHLRFPERLIQEDEAWHWYYFSVIKDIFYLNKVFYNRVVNIDSTMTQRDLNNINVLDMLYILEHIYDYLQKNGLYEKYHKQYEKYFVAHKNAILKRCGTDQNLYENANNKIQELSKIVKISEQGSTVFISLGENGLADNIFKRHNLKSFSTPYSDSRSNMDYAIYLESTSYKDLLDTEKMKYDSVGKVKIIRSTSITKADNIYSESPAKGFGIYRDIISSTKDKEALKTAIQTMSELKNINEKIVFFYHYRVNNNFNLKSIFQKADEFLKFHSKKNKPFMIIFSQKIISNKFDRKIIYKKITPNIHFFEFHTKQAWSGDNPDLFLAKIDDDLIKEMIENVKNIVK
jgi:lipopolysaccharide biosynthesis glycosyltransferase